MSSGTTRVISLEDFLSFIFWTLFQKGDTLGETQWAGWFLISAWAAAKVTRPHIRGKKIDRWWFLFLFGFWPYTVHHSNINMSSLLSLFWHHVILMWLWSCQQNPIISVMAVFISNQQCVNIKETALVILWWEIVVICHISDNVSLDLLLLPISEQVSTFIDFLSVSHTWK